MLQSSYQDAIQPQLLLVDGGISAGGGLADVATPFLQTLDLMSKEVTPQSFVDELESSNQYRHWANVASVESGVTVNPQINHGRPTVSGTRIPVSRIVGFLSRHDVGDLLRDFPALDERKVNQAVNYAIEALGG